MATTIWKVFSFWEVDVVKDGHADMKVQGETSIKIYCKVLARSVVGPIASC